MKSREVDQVNGDKLRQLREERGWDCVYLAKISSLSVSQVHALEEGGTDCFYTVQIKNNAARKLAKVLGVSEDVVIQADVAADALESAPLENQFVPEQTLLNSRSLYAKSPPSTWLGYGVMSLLLVAGLGWWVLRPSTLSLRPQEVMGAATTSSKMAASTETDKLWASSETAGPAAQPPAVALVTAPTPAASSLPAAQIHPNEFEIAPASLPAVADSACLFEGDVAVLEANKPTKSAEKVSLMLHKGGLLCVQDGTGKIWQENLKPWLGRTYFGKAPWKIHSPVLPQADVYFQGEKIKLVSGNSRTIALNGKEFDR